MSSQRVRRAGRTDFHGNRPGADGEEVRSRRGFPPERICALASGRYDNLAVHVDWNMEPSFRRAVLEETQRIPSGQTRTYGWLAERVGRPRAARAVGRVMATNPLPLVVPCHRVVGSNGSLTGYGGGLRMKEALLRAEGAL